jgi:hypothetical protein
MVLETPISKITRVKWTGHVAQAMQCLLCEQEALSSNSRQTHQKKKKEKKKERKKKKHLWMSALCPTLMLLFLSSQWVVCVLVFHRKQIFLLTIVCEASSL